MTFRDDSDAVRARADALARENRELRQQLVEREEQAAAKAQQPVGPRRHAARLIKGGVALLVLMALLAVSRRVPLVVVFPGLLLAVLLVCLGLIASLIHVAGPDEALVVAGRQHLGPDGRPVGYRIVVGGRVLQIPLLEQVERVSLRAFAVPVAAARVSSKGGRLVDVEATAVVKISGEATRLARAVARFSGGGQPAVARVAQDTIEGTLRQLLASYTLEELQQDQLKVAQDLLTEVDIDFEKLGLEADSFKLNGACSSPSNRKDHRKET